MEPEQTVALWQIQLCGLQNDLRDRQRRFTGSSCRQLVQTRATQPCRGAALTPSTGGSLQGIRRLSRAGTDLGLHSERLNSALQKATSGDLCHSLSNSEVSVSKRHHINSAECSLSSSDVSASKTREAAGHTTGNPESDTAQLTAMPVA